MTSTLPGPAAAGRHLTCAQCGSASTPGARFCPACGAPQPVAPTTQLGSDAPAGAFAAPAVSFGSPEPADPSRRRNRRLTMIATGAVLGLIVAGASAGWLLIDSAAEKQLASSQASLAGALDALTDADSTAEIRAAGESVTAAATQVETFLAAEAQDDRTEGLTDTAEALRAIAGLSTLAGDETNPWKTGEPALRELSGSSDESVAELGVAADAAADHVDTVVKQARADYREWAAENAEQVAARDAAITAATTYQSRVAEYLEEYGALRADLNSYIEKVDSEGSTMDEGYAEFSHAAQGRREVRDDLAALTPPTEASRSHDRLLSVLDDGISAVEAAERALDVAECTIFGCDVLDQPAWAEFRDESKRITTAFAQAADAVRADAQAAVDTAKDIALPDKPDF